MVTEIRVCQFLRLHTTEGQTHRYQNYFSRVNKVFIGETYSFVPFQVEGGVSSLNADNDQLTILIPATEYAIRLVEQGDGNKKSRLELYTRFVNSNDQIITGSHDSYFVGIGAAFSDDTVELRFRSAIDGITQNMPARKLSRENAGILPLDAQLSLR
tara:strand:- start:100 stop:570 length:471 start_codon:yes stop_codon:yes gene_type:complete